VKDTFIDILIRLAGIGMLGAIVWYLVSGIEMNPETMRKKIEWSIKKRLDDYARMKFSEENLGRIAHDVIKVLDRHEKSEEEIKKRGRVE